MTVFEGGKMTHFKLINDDDTLETALPQTACTSDQCTIDFSHCNNIDYCFWDFGAGCATSDMCGVDF